MIQAGGTGDKIDLFSECYLFFRVAGLTGDRGWWNWERDLVEEQKALTEPQICKICEDSGFRDLALPILAHNTTVTLPGRLCCHLSSLWDPPESAGGFPVPTLDS